tara:strand:+ start:129 stop:3362 length:3234 start_codon:yes stop_codon:yes gene_type:complete
MNLNDNQIMNVIKFQRKYRFLKNELNSIESRISFLKDYLFNMINNISYLRNIGVMDQNNISIEILNRLSESIDLIKSFPLNISIKNLNDSDRSIIRMNLNLIKITNELKKYSNLIGPNSMNYILKLFYQDDWVNDMNDEELEQILFFSRFFNIISVWESDNHTQEITVKKNEDNNLISKDILESLLGDSSTSMIINKNSNIPAFLKNISALVEKKISSPKRSRKNHFRRIDCISVLDKDKITVKKNQFAESLFEDKSGACIFLRFKQKFMVLQGLFKDDLLDISKTLPFIKKKFISLKKTINYEVLIIPKDFKNNFLKTLNLRDIVVSSTEEITNDLRKKYLEFKNICDKSLLSLINEFLLASKYRKIDMLSLLLMSDIENQKLGYILYDILKTKDKRGIAGKIYNSLHYSLRGLLDNAEKKVQEDEEKLSKLSSSDIPYERRINLMKSNESVKSKAMEKYKAIKSNFQGDSKAQAWLDGVLKIPFGVFKENPIMSFKNSFAEKIKSKYPDGNFNTEFEIDTYIKDKDNDVDINIKKEWMTYQSDKMSYLQDVRTTFDDAVFGHKEAKLQLERIFAQWINGESKGAILGLVGPPGTGKTSLAKRGLSQCLKDKDGNPRPFAFLPIGGSVNGSTLVGHNYTYVGSTWGRIADILMTTECMNPIIFIDEVDKVSHTEHGREIISILTHLTDLTQNDEFEDKYFSGVKLDLSKALIVFSFNDAGLIDPILRDRITIIETNPLNLPEKITILNDYMIPEIFAEVGFDKSEIIFSDEILEFIITTYTNEAGVRKIKEKIYDVIRDINLQRFHDSSVMLPYIVTKEFIERIFENKPKIRTKRIQDKPAVGLVNGLYATVSGIGGLTVIQVMKYPSKNMLELSLTGKQGDVMRESVDYALKIAFSLLPTELKDKIIEDANNNKAFGFHVHTPDAATPKDGPSAGAAMTLAIYSQLTGIKINNKIAMTGEIDLLGHISAIGGVSAKLNGAKKAGATLVLIPKENLEDLEKMRREHISPEDDDFKVIGVETIQEVFTHALCHEEDDIKQPSSPKKYNLLNFLNLEKVVDQEVDTDTELDTGSDTEV